MERGGLKTCIKGAQLLYLWKNKTDWHVARKTDRIAYRDQRL